jgi:hypothetical protein
MKWSVDFTLPLGFGDPAAAAGNTGHWTLRRPRERCTYRTGPSAEIELGTVGAQRGAWVSGCSREQRTHSTGQERSVTIGSIRVCGPPGDQDDGQSSKKIGCT